MKLRVSSYFLIAIALLALAFFFGSLGYASFKTRLLPMIISGIVFVLVVIELWRELSSKPGQKEVQEKPKEPWRRIFAHGAWIVGFAVTIYIVGFGIAIPLFVLSYTKSHGGGWLGSIILAALLTTVCYGAFRYLLNVDLYPGILFE